MRRKLMTAGFVAFAAFLESIEAQPRQAPPPAGPPKAFQVPRRETYMLKNGLRVSLIPYGTLPLVMVRAVVGGGTGNEGATQTGLTEFVASMMREGTATKSGAELAAAAARIGGQLTIQPAYDETSAGLQVLPEFAPDAVKLIADVSRHPSFPESELERVRGNLLRARSVALSSAGPPASAAFAKQVYGDHGYGRLRPSEAQLKSLTLDDIRKFYDDNFGARRTHLYVAGHFDSSDVKKAITAAFDGWAEGTPLKRIGPKLTPQKSLTLIDRPGSAQSALRIGLPVAISPGDPDYAAMEMMDALLGRGFNARITNNIREEKGYTYEPFSYLDIRYHSAVWLEFADVSTADTANAIKEILFEIERLRKEPPSAEELRQTQSLLNYVHVFRTLQHDYLVQRFVELDLRGLDDNSLRTSVMRVNAVTAADIRRMAQRHLDTGKITIVVVGDMAKIEESLKPYR